MLWRSYENLSQRTVSAASHRQTKNNVSETQKLFQKDNGIPELFTGGLSYRATVALQSRLCWKQKEFQFKAPCQL
uniref:Uncharacterized protein n=1 Tax=Apteryx owenii TaxID=8824 RepID=A0A8B9NSW4_APTOW